MDVAPIPKQIARLEARISPETKAMLQKAADLEGRTLTDFVIASVQAEALRVIERHQTLKLSMGDAEAFVDALLNLPKPNDALKAAALRYKQVISDLIKPTNTKIATKIPTPITQRYISTTTVAVMNNNTSQLCCVTLSISDCRDIFH